MGANLTYIIAFGYGLLSFFTPCILPLLPVYFGYLAGDAVTNFDKKKINRKLMINALGFVLGITLLNVLLGFGFRSLTTVISGYSNVFRYIGGGLMILFGLYFILGIRWLFVEKERKVQFKSYSPSFIKSFVLGITFSFGWTPCNGPIIASILMIASFEANYMRAGGLMLAYSAGFAIVFLLSALLVGVFVSKVNKVYKYFGVIKKISGVIMICMGVLLILNKLTWLAV
jgi:cytochrome c-type biogenesis protein